MIKHIAALPAIFLCATLYANVDISEKLDIFTRESELLTTFTLPNGLHVILKPDHSAPVATVQFWIGTGSIHEEQFMGSGISHAVEHMIFKGTPTIEPGELSQKIQEAGGRLNAYTSLDRTVYFADLPSEHWQLAFDLYAESLFHPDFPEDEWQKEREVIIREIAMGEDNPSRVLIRYLWQTAVRFAPYRHPIIGYTDTFSMLTRDDLVTFHQRHYTPCNMTLIIIGDIDIAAVRKHVTHVLSAHARPPRAPVVLPTEPEQATPRVARFTEQHNITRMAQMWTAPVFPHPDAAALQVLAHIAGSGRTARLHRALVEDEGLLLGISAWYFDRGYWGISSQMEPEKETVALAALTEQVEQLRSATFTQDEVDRAIRSIVTRTLRSFTTMSGQAAHYGAMQNRTGNPRSDRMLLEQIAEVTPDDVARVAAKWLQPETLSRVIVSPESEDIEPSEQTITDLADMETVHMANGVTLLLRPNPRLPFVYISAALQGGLLSEDDEQVGITALMSELLTRGTKTRSRDEIAKTIESRGASLSAFSGFNAFGLNGQSLSGDVETLIELLVDSLLHPIFPEDELERQRTRQIAAIRQAQEQPMSQAGQEMRQMLFPGHPYRNMPNGTEETVASITRADIEAHHQHLTTASNLVIAIFGDIQTDAVVAQLQDALQDISTAPAPEVTHPRPRQIDEILRTEQSVPRQQAIVLIGFPSVDMFDPDADALNLLQTALSGMASALFREIREKRGLAYFTGASQQTGLHPGLFTFYAGTEPDATTTVEELLHLEIDRVREHGLTESEFKRARAQLLASHDMRLQNQGSMATDAALHERYGLGGAYPYAFPDRIRAITPKDVQTAAARIFNENAQATVILIPEHAASNAGTIDE